MEGPPVFVQRVQVPYERSAVHIVRMDLAASLDRDTALEALRRAPLVHVEAGLATTADLQEERRDRGLLRGDAPEVFVWEGSVDVAGTHLHFIADVCPFAVPIPEILAGVRDLIGGSA